MSSVSWIPERGSDIGRKRAAGHGRKRITERRRLRFGNIAMRRRLRMARVNRLRSQTRLKNFLQRTASVKDAGLHRADTAFQNFGNFLVTQAFQVTQDHSAAENLVNLLQSAVDDGLNFQGRELVKRRGAEILDFDARVTFFRFGVYGNVFLQVALEPALVIQRLANRDAVKPRFQRAALAEIANAAKGLQENFLGTVGSVGSIAKHAENEVIDRSMIVSDEPVEGRLRAGLQLMDKIGFIAAPTKGTSPIGHCRPFRPAAEKRATLLNGPTYLRVCKYKP